MKTEDYWSLGLLGLSVGALLAGVIIGRVLPNRPNSVVRVVFPVAALLTLGAFAVFVFFARSAVKG